MIRFLRLVFAVSGAWIVLLPVLGTKQLELWPILPNAQTVTHLAITPAT
jgi:hypothetical protein